MIACPTPTDSQVIGWKPWELPFSHQNRIVLLTDLHSEHFWGLQTSSSFWCITQSFLGAYKATVSHMKEHSNTFQIISKSLMFINEMPIFWWNSYSNSSMPRIHTLHNQYFTSFLKNCSKTRFHSSFLLLQSWNNPVCQRKEGYHCTYCYPNNFLVWPQNGNTLEWCQGFLWDEPKVIVKVWITKVNCCFPERCWSYASHCQFCFLVEINLSKIASQSMTVGGLIFTFLWTIPIIPLNELVVLFTRDPHALGPSVISLAL